MASETCRGSVSQHNTSTYWPKRVITWVSDEGYT